MFVPRALQDVAKQIRQSRSRDALLSLAEDIPKLENLKRDWAAIQDRRLPDYLRSEAFAPTCFLAFAFERQWYRQGFWPHFSTSSTPDLRKITGPTAWLLIQHGPYRVFPYWLAHEGHRVVVATDADNAAANGDLTQATELEAYERALERIGVASQPGWRDILERVRFFDVTSPRGIAGILGSITEGTSVVLFLDGNRSLGASQQRARRFVTCEIELSLNTGLLELIQRRGVNANLVLCHSSLTEGHRIPAYSASYGLPPTADELLVNAGATLTAFRDRSLLQPTAWESLLENVRFTQQEPGRS